MATIAFPFKNQLALRIANCITSDIEKLEKELTGGRKTNWQAFERPFKAHYANAIVTTHADKEDKIMELLPPYERRAEEYSADKNRRGRPLTTFVNMETTDNIPVPQVRHTYNMPARDAQTSAHEAAQSDPLSDAVAEILEQHERPTSVQDGAQAIPQGEAIHDLMAALARLAPQPKAQTMVRKLVKDEISRVHMPTIITIERIDENNNAVREDMGVQHRCFADLLKLAQIKGPDGYVYPVWLPGPAGSGKTTAAKNAAKALCIPFHHTGAVDNVYQLIGFRDAAGHYHRTTFREAYEHGGVFLWDEVDASNPNTLVAFNAAIENGECVFPDAVVKRHANCIMIAAANTYGTGATHEYVGRNKIDAATLDRFIILDWPYDEIMERAIAGDNDWTAYVQKVRAAVKQAGIKHIVSPRASFRGRVSQQTYTKVEATQIPTAAQLSRMPWRVRRDGFINMLRTLGLDPADYRVERVRIAERMRYRRTLEQATPEQQADEDQDSGADVREAWDAGAIMDRARARHQRRHRA